MNNDLISRSELKKAICDSGYSHYFEIFAIIDNAPTVEMLPMCMAKDEAICEEMTTDGHCNYLKPCPNKEERPKGEWKIIRHDDHYLMGIYQCNLCSYKYACPDEFARNFCPNCGADMRGGDKE